MSVFCPKCGMKTFNEYTCDHCQHTIKEEKVLKKNWQPPKPNIYILQKQKNNTIIFNKNTLLIVAISIIAISLAYLAYTKYEERKWLEEFAGTTDPKEFKKNLKKQIERNEKLAEELAEEFTKKQLKIFKTIDLPIYNKQ